MKAYIAGPISGIAGDNEGAFLYVEKLLIDLGIETVNPLKEGRKLLENAILEPNYVDYICMGLSLLFTCDIIVLLPNWCTSPGAQMECILAKRLGLPMYNAEKLPDLVKMEVDMEKSRYNER